MTATLFNLEPYDPCPCGSGKKYKFCCAEKNKARRHGRFPVATISLRGPDDQAATHVRVEIDHDTVIGLLDLKTVLWPIDTTPPDAHVVDQIKRHMAEHGVKTVEVIDKIDGCPHESGVDRSYLRDCPQCPWWAGKQGGAMQRALELAETEAVDQADYPFGDNTDSEDDDSDDQGDWDDDERSDEEVDATTARIDAVLAQGGADDLLDLQSMLNHLKQRLELPCKVLCSEDLAWEEKYIVGGISPAEHERLRQDRPSCCDEYELLKVTRPLHSEWTIQSDDLSAHVRRLSDNKEFVLGLSEIEATDTQSANYQLLDDYSFWFVNCHCY